MQTKRIGLFHVPLITGRCDIPHKDIELYVREKMREQGSYTSYYDHQLNKEIVEGLPHRAAMESAMTEISLEFLELRGADISKYEQVKPWYWFSVYKSGAEHCLHVHPSTCVAGTYYPYADDNSAPIRFRNPNNTLISMSEPWASNDWYFHYPTTGDINVWPPWLEHQIRPKDSVPEEEARIAISFNFAKPS